MVLDLACFGVLAALFGSLVLHVECKTNSPDVSALGVLYTSLNSPSQLTGWSSSGGDPCGDGWKGVECSGSSVTEIKLSGLGLSGSMGYQLSSLTYVTHFDMSKNNLQGDIPYQLPPNALHIDLSRNTLTGGVPYSISQMSDLKYLNLGHNKLSGQLSDMFGQLPSLSELDLSFNALSGNLPATFASLSSMRTMHLENNKFSGKINVLASLPLEELSVADNRFTGWIPSKLKDIGYLETEGNPWSSGPAPPGSFNGEKGNQQKNSSKGANKSTIVGGVVAAAAISVLVLIVVVLVVFARRSSSLHASHFLDEEKSSQSRPFTPLVSQEFKDPELMRQTLSRKSIQTSVSLDLKTPSDRHKSLNDTEFANKFNAMRRESSINATIYTLEDLQQGTGNFGAKYLLGRGSLGSVYRAKYIDGKVLAVKKMNMMSSEDFNNMLSEISRLQHPNIIKLVGYCSELSYQLLIYEFMRNGSLHDFLHLSDDYSKPLTWNTRIRIALGTAKALEYLHDGPATVHRNIKSSNILLDAELKPHISDCGFTNLYQGVAKSSTDGYNAPECTKASAYTSKSDVYSFGIVMLELLTGRMPFSSSKPKAEQSLVQWATPQLHDIDALEKMVDPALRGLYPPKSLSRFADIIALCVQIEPEFRPAMPEVVQALVRCERS